MNLIQQALEQTGRANYGKVADRLFNDLERIYDRNIGWIENIIKTDNSNEDIDISS